MSDLAKLFARSLCVFMGCVALTACTRPDHATDTLRKQGFTDISITGYDFFACGKDDAFSTGFTAKSVNGASVSGTVCAGLLKGSTIRFD